MGVIEIFSKRQKRLRGQMPDVYSYDTIPQPLRVQLVHIWHDTLGNDADYTHSTRNPSEAYKLIVDTLCREYGCFLLPGAKDYGRRHYLAELVDYVLQEEDPERVLDAIEFSFQIVNCVTRDWRYLHRYDASKRADAAIEELNFRFREHGVGYQFVDDRIIRVDSELVHAEVVKPALAFLRAPEYAGPQAEFLNAYEHYRHGKEKEALNECLKALESVMKVICAKRKWKYDSNATSKTLIQTLLDNSLIPKFWEQHFSALRSVLESGVPTARNRLGGHGQGTAIVQVPGYLVAYVLHLTASSIVFLCEAERSLP